MGEYERMVIDFTLIVVAPHLGALVLTVALIALAAVAIRAVRVPGRATAVAAVLLMVAAWATTASGRVVAVEKRARAPSALEFIRA